MTSGLYRYHSNSGTYLVYVVSKGRKWITFVSMGTVPIAIRRTKLINGRYFKPMQYTGDCKARILDVGTRLGITKGAERLLGRV